MASDIPYITPDPTPRPRSSRLVPLIAVAGIVLLAALILPTLWAARNVARYAQCVNNLKQIGIALANYHEEHQCYPPAYVADERGRPMHSWRVLILPYLEDPQAASVYLSYDLREPWDGPNNRKLVDQMPPVYACPNSANHRRGTTNYVAVVGNETMWPGRTSLAVREIADGIHQTIAVAESVRQDIGWLEPRDISIDELNTIVPPPELGFPMTHPGGANVLFADGSVHPLHKSTRPSEVRALATKAGGEQVDPAKYGY